MIYTRNIGVFLWLYAVVTFAIPCSSFLSTRGTTEVSCKTSLAAAYTEAFHVTPPYLAVITEPDACANTERLEATYKAIESAVSTRRVALVSIRLSTTINSAPFYDRALQLTKRLIQLSEKRDSTGSSPAFRVVCSSDWWEMAVAANAHGIHVKESHLSQIPSFRQAAPRDDFLIGTSTHSVESALDSFATYHPDYYFVGTCFLTESHPEKMADDLEGPTLPGSVRKVLLTATRELPDAGTCPTVFAIGGIDATNCQVPLAHGADGVAVIRAVLQAKDPAAVSSTMYGEMKSALDSRSENE